MQQKIIIICGPTATGKTSLAIDIANEIGGVIINADSQQVYKEIPIITAQPNRLELAQAPHRLYGVISVRENFSVALWLEAVSIEIKDVLAQGKTPILVGGTGMYIKALVEGIAQVPEIKAEVRGQVRQICNEEGAESIHAKLSLVDPTIARKLNPADRQRVLRAYEVFLGTGKSLLYWQSQKTTPLFPRDIFDIRIIMPERADIYDKCNRRILAMLENGLIDEIRELYKMHLPQIFPAMRACGLREFIEYLNGNVSLEQATSSAQQATRHYVKRQFTWFRHQINYASPASFSTKTD